MKPIQFSREKVLQALCQWLVSGGEISQIELQFLKNIRSKTSKKFFSNLFIKPMSRFFGQKNKMFSVGNLLRLI